MGESIDEQFIQQVNEHAGIAHKVCSLYAQDPDDRADILQEMMYQLWKSYPVFDGRSKFSTWMYRVCLNTTLGWRRKKQAFSNESISRKHHQIAEQHPEYDQENSRQLFQAIGTLSPLNKAIVLLYLDELSYEEIASITGLTKTHVSVRLVRIKKELEIQIKKQINPTEDVHAR